MRELPTPTDVMMMVAERRGLPAFLNSVRKVVQRGQLVVSIGEMEESFSSIAVAYVLLNTTTYSIKPCFVYVTRCSFAKPVRKLKKNRASERETRELLISRELLLVPSRLFFWLRVEELV